MYDYRMIDIHRRGDFNDSVLFCERIKAVYISHQDVAQFKHLSVNNLLLNNRNDGRVSLSFAAWTGFRLLLHVDGVFTTYTAIKMGHLFCFPAELSSAVEEARRQMLNRSVLIKHLKYLMGMVA